MCDFNGKMPLLAAACGDDYGDGGRGRNGGNSGSSSFVASGHTSGEWTVTTSDFLNSMVKSG